MKFSRKLRHQIRDYIAITVGAFVMAVGIGVFLIEAKVVPGGVSGIAMTIHYLSDYKVPVGLLIWIINIPPNRIYNLHLLHKFQACFFIDVLLDTVFCNTLPFCIIDYRL